MDPIRVGINGFGRIGRCAFKQLLADRRFMVVGINDLASVADLAYLLKYDSVYGRYPPGIANDDHAISVEDVQVPFFSEPDPAAIPWRRLGADVVIESSGAFRKREKAARHLEAGARKVIVSAPSSDTDGTFVVGVNGDAYDPAVHHVVSMASCTTNCLAPVAKVLVDAFGVEDLMMTTVHAYTSSQSLVDVPARKRRRGRAAAVSIVPTTTGATDATAKVIPALEGRIAGMALRVPVPDGSVTDIVATLHAEVTVEAIHQALRDAAARPPLRGVLRVSDEELVSRDIVGDTYSSIVDASGTLVLRRRVVKIVAWYDNEWGYAARLVDFTRLVGT